VLRSEVDEVLRRDFVALRDTTVEEESWLRRVLEGHVRFTASPRASRLLTRRNVVPFLRVQPLTFQGSLQSVWGPLLEQLKDHQSVFAARAGRTAGAPQVPLHV
jgi:hypothetical protein